MNFKYLICCFLLLIMVVYPMTSQRCSIDETPTSIHVKTSQFTIDIHKSAFGWIVHKGERMVMDCPEMKTIFLQRGNQMDYVDRITKIEQHKDSLKLTLLTQSTGTIVNLVFAFSATNFSVKISTQIPNAKLGINLKLQPGVFWYGGNITSAHIWPSNHESFEVDPFYSCSNQTSPIWIASSGVGLFVDTYHTMGYSFNMGQSNLFSIHVKDVNTLNFVVPIGDNIVEAHKAIIGIVGKPERIPPVEYFSHAIFNSWIEFKKDVNQAGLLEYASRIRKEHVPCTILEIDDKWTPMYGDFEFDTLKFSDPGRMASELKGKGFKLALWVTPFVEESSSSFQYLKNNSLLILQPGSQVPYITEWWNGKAALVDLSNPMAYEWFLTRLKSIQARYDIAGFKFDAGDADFLDRPFKSYGNITTIQYTDLFAGLGKYFDINELRVSWLTQKLGLVQRLRDKNSDRQRNWIHHSSRNGRRNHWVSIFLS